MVAWTYFLDIMTSIKMWRRRNIRKEREDYMEAVFGDADDPAEHDEELQKKLAENDIIAKKRMRVGSVFLNFFSNFALLCDLNWIIMFIRFCIVFFMHLDLMFLNFILEIIIYSICHSQYSLNSYYLRNKHVKVQK